MRIEIRDDMCWSHVIDSADYELIGRWLAEKAKLLMSADARYNHPFHVDIWPSGATHDADIEVIKQANMPVTSTDSLYNLDFSIILLTSSSVMADAISLV